MKKKNLVLGYVIGCLVLWLVLPQPTLGEQTKIRVKVENATIRSAPSLESDVIESKVALGTLFEKEKTAGDWFEIRFRNKLGVLVTGYIHKMYVESVEERLETEKEETKKPAVPPSRPAKPVKPLKRIQAKGDFAVMGGFVSGSSLSNSSAYSANWSDDLLETVIEAGTITHGIGNPLGLGLSLSYLFSGGLGVQVRFDYNLNRTLKEGENQSSYAIGWSWSDGRNAGDEESWGATGEFSLAPLSLNVIYKAQSQGRFIPYISGGVSYFTGKVKANTIRGYGLTWTSGDYQYIDYIDVPLSIDASIGHIGFNVGAGIDFRLASKVAVSVEAIYFVGKTSEEPWNPVPGTYPGNIFPDVRWTLDQEFADSILEEVDPLEIKASFLKIQAGIKFYF